MLDHTDPVRDLVRRAYHVDEDLDLTAGLLDVVRRAEPPPIEIPVHREARRAEPRRRRSRLTSLAAFAAAIAVLLAGAFVARGPHRAATPGAGGATSAAADTGSGPSALPTPCAGDWTLTLHGAQFSVTGSNPLCPPLPRGQLWLLDAARGNGLIQPGDATVWPLTPAGTPTATLTPPFTFTLKGWPGAVHGHYYEVWYVPPGGGTAHAGDDAMTVFDHAYTVSSRLVQR